jgi:hypothetical protein
MYICFLHEMMHFAQKQAAAQGPIPADPRRALRIIHEIDLISSRFRVKIEEGIDKA